jgi:hypothetical protein
MDVTDYCKGYDLGHWCHNMAHVRIPMLEIAVETAAVALFQAEISKHVEPDTVLNRGP